VSVISSRFAAELNEKRMRVAYLSAQTRTKLSNQIRTLRTDRGWSQGDFARILNKPQSNVSRLENRQYGKFNLTTLFELASAFDVGLVVKFVAYEDFLRDTENLGEDALKVRSFNKNALNEICEDFAALGGLGLWTGTHSELIPTGNTLVDQNALTGFSAAGLTAAGLPITLDLNKLAYTENQLGILNTLPFNSGIYQVRLPSPQEEIARLRHALAESEREKVALRAERDALRRDALRIELDHARSAARSQDNQLEHLGVAPVFMIERQNRSGLI
jgi:transcriptional regulator with XRE-family HTH domain